MCNILGLLRTFDFQISAKSQGPSFTSDQTEQQVCFSERKATAMYSSGTQKHVSRSRTSNWCSRAVRDYMQRMCSRTMKSIGSLYWSQIFQVIWRRKLDVVHCIRSPCLTGLLVNIEIFLCSFKSHVTILGKQY